MVALELKKMSKRIKLNSNKKVFCHNKETILPKLSHEEAYDNIRTIAFREKDLKKLQILRRKYKVSRSAIIRILLDNV